MKKILIANRWKTPDGTILWSKHVHDFVQHQDKVVHDSYFVDGGIHYIRKSVNGIPMANCCIYADDPFDVVRKYEVRGSFVKKDDYSKPAFVPIYQMSDLHLINCLTYTYKNKPILELYNVHAHLYVKELLYRIENEMFLDEYDYTSKALNKKPVYEKVQMKVGDNQSYLVKNFAFADIIDVLSKVDSKESVHCGKTYYVLCLLNIIFTSLEEREEDALLG